MQTTFLPGKFLLTATLLAAAASSLQAQLKINNLQLFRNHSYSLNENMDELLRLTPEQSSKLNEAMEKKLTDPTFVATQDAFKASGSDEDKRAFYSARETAEAAYKQTVEETLTAEQKELIEKVSDFSKIVWDELDEIKHWGDRMRKMREIGPERLKEILTVEQLSILGIGVPASEPTQPPQSAPEPETKPAPPADTSADL